MIDDKMHLVDWLNDKPDIRKHRENILKLAINMVRVSYGFGWGGLETCLEFADSFGGLPPTKEAWWTRLQIASKVYYDCGLNLKCSRDYLGL